ncbi:MAG: PH domain-containing protein [Oscillospiraceae bacterium]|nr:PH domain-containing protein [Oscillospiraceae bacterium]
MKFKTKVDWFIHLSFAIMPITNIMLIIMFISSPTVINGVCASIFLITNIIIMPWWFNTYYILEESELLIKVGGFGKGKRIAYSDITSVGETRNPLASAALSMDRIEIKFRDGKTKSFTNVIYISPKEKQEFLKLLDEKRNK